MKLNAIIFIIICFLTQVNAKSFGQLITIKKQNVLLEEVISELEKQSGYVFFYNEEDVRSFDRISVDLQKVTFEKALTQVFKNSGFAYEFFEKTIVLKRVKATANKPEKQSFITGKVVDAYGKGVGGASIRIKSDTLKAVVSQDNGLFYLPLSANGSTVQISHVSYFTTEVLINNPNKFYEVPMKAKEIQFEEVIVTGITQRKKESFTGATSSFTGEELKLVSNQNVLTAIRSLDPSLLQIENNNMGSNPNQLPKIELRGQTSIASNSLEDEFSSDPNLPLFVLDGFETNLRTIVDLDMNIVQSVTILKDAASTAIYGSRASNGVVVIETIKPKPGKIQVSYSADLRVESPDLSSYNLMNASEKLEFERLSGRYTAGEGLNSQQFDLDHLYNTRLNNVLRGVDTYWLDKPLQTGSSHRHSLSARGGEGSLIFDVSLNYKDTKGVMIGSKRDDWGANISLSYRLNKLNISNRAFVNGYDSFESPYGNFSTWAKLNPYYEFQDGSNQYLGNGTASNPLYIENPMYNASLNSFDKSKNYEISNNLQVNYDFSNSLRFSVSGQIAKGNTNANKFISPLHTQFIQVANNKRGQLNHTESSAFRYTLNAMLTYAKILKEVHSLTGNLRAEISETQNLSNGYVAVGFPSASNGNPTFSYGYQDGSKPRSHSRLSRRNSMMASINYSYDQKYNADINFSMDGSTVFGSNQLYAPNYAFGLSWNIHKESFMQNLSWLDVWRLRGNIGLTGNQNFGSNSQAIYNYYLDINRFEQGIYLENLGTPNLKWQNTRQISLGMDLGLMNKRMNIQINGYDKYTDPLVVNITLPSSVGFGSYQTNAGVLAVKGLEATVNYAVIYRPDQRIIWNLGVTASSYKQRYDKFNNRLEGLNKDLQESNSLVQYRDGYSPNDLWAVRSLGIDPTSGREVFLKKDGQYSFIYDANDVVRVGNSQPLAEGVLRSTLTIKNFSAQVMLRYMLRKDQFNSALYNKVENISISNVENNQDVRAFYDRWKNPGDLAQFKAISITESSPMSSRFIQRENSLSGESISLSYNFKEQSWLDRAKLSNLRLTAFMNDVFYSSTIRKERGIEYPFARSVSMSISATLK